MSFKKLGLSHHLVRALQLQNISEPLPIQEAAIPVILNGHDVLGIAPTGAGKTASFMAPILELRQNANYQNARSIPVLVIVPTRELAIQIHEFVEACTPYLRREIRSMAVYGGVSINPQMRYLNGVEILIATPGRLLDLIDHKSITISNISTLIIDEADKIFNHGFEEELHTILAQVPKNCQHLLFSATLSSKVEAIKKTLNILPEILDVNAAEIQNDNIEQIAYHTAAERKGPLLRYILKTEKFRQTLIFVSSTRTADNLVEKLKKNGLKAITLHGKKSQGARIDALQQFKNGEVPILITTDLLARGIHIEELPAVINYELPRSPLDYIHRIGRTGRVHQKGKAITLLTDEDTHHFKIIQKKMKKQVPLHNTDQLDLHGY